MNVLHMHMYLVGKITLAALLIMYPAENVSSVATKTAVQQQNKGDHI